MSVKARLVAKVGEYEKNGETKGEYVRLGVLMAGDNGEFMILDPTVSLAGVLAKQRAYSHSQGKQMRDSIMVSMFSDDRSSQQPSPNSQQPEFDDELPPF